MDAPIDPEWTFTEAVQHLSAMYEPGGKTDGPLRNRMIEMWGQVVGRSRAVREFDEAINAFGSWHAASKALHSTVKTLKRFRATFEKLPLILEPASREGLMLYFNSRLTHIDRFLIDGVILAILGKDTDCQVVDFRQREDSAIVLLQASRREDLVAVAEVIYRRIWYKQQQSAPGQALVEVGRLLGPSALDLLSDLLARLDRLELRINKQQAWTWELGQDLLQLARPIRIFLIYAARDRTLAKELVGHLQPLVSQGVLDTFDHSRLLAGDNAGDLLGARLDTADAILVLVSAALYEDGPLQAQVARALARQKDGARVIPVLLRAVSWEGTALAGLKALPEDGRPITKWEDRDEAWAGVVSGIRRVLLSVA